jgi:hypothetical protein
LKKKVKKKRLKLNDQFKVWGIVVIVLAMFAFQFSWDFDLNKIVSKEMPKPIWGFLTLMITKMFMAMGGNKIKALRERVFIKLKGFLMLGLILYCVVSHYFDFAVAEIAWSLLGTTVGLVFDEGGT